MLEVTPRTRLTRKPDRQVTDRRMLHEILDAGIVAHIALCADGQPMVLPVGYGRDGERLLIHGSTGAGLLRRAAAGAQVAVVVTLLDGLVYARSMFDSSMNYRSAVVFGQTTALSGDAKLDALRLISERLMPGRWSEVRPPKPKELAATLVLELPLDEASVKIRTGPPSEDHPDQEDPLAWSGVLPLRAVADEAIAAPNVRPGVATPPSIDAARARVAAIDGTQL
jgi:uncharacterized protein